MLEFMDTMLGFYSDLQRMPKGVLSGMTKLRRKVRKLMVMEGSKAL